MPQYFYSVNNKSVSETDEGEALTNDEAAWHEATLVAGEIFKDLDGDFRPGQEWKLEVQDEHHRPIFLISIISKDLK